MQYQTSVLNSHGSNGISNDNITQQSLDNGKLQNEGDGGGHSSKFPPQGTFERTSFEQLMRQYDHKHDLPPTLELTQAFLMTQNMKETASRVNGLTAGGSGYYLKNDYVGDSMRLSDAMQSVSRLLGNLGPSDKASNFLLEQRNLMRAQSRENKDIRELIEEQIIDGLEYVRVKEKIAETKSRVRDLIDLQFTSDEGDNLQTERQEEPVVGPLSLIKNKEGNGSDTQEDSEEANKNREQNEIKIKAIIKQIRKDGKEYLSLKEYGYNDLEKLSLQTICNKLKKNQRYRKKREIKAQSKGVINILKDTQDQLKYELASLENKTDQFKDQKKDLERFVKQYELIYGSEKRLKGQETFEKSMSEIDTFPMNSRSYELQNILFSYCGINLNGNLNRKSKIKDQLFGKTKKLPPKSSLLQNYQDTGDNKIGQQFNENPLTSQAKKKNVELVKVIGLEPEKMFTSLNKYKIQIDKIPKFSNQFDRAEPILPGLNMTVAGQLITGNQQQMSFARVDGRNVISLQFNPYELEDPQKKKIYDQAMKDIIEQREKIKTISKQAREKQESSNIKRAWLNIVKKDIPKAFRGYQKYKQDLENNNKKQSSNCLKEVRKKALKTQRLVKESNMRAKKITREMMNFWKRRDKEIADLKRRKEKVEKEFRRKQEEEKEALLQKKRLEFIMQQSEIYAHFMSKKLGLAEEQKQQREQDLQEEEQDNFRRVQIDEHSAKLQVASMINETRQRVNKFDQEVPSNNKMKNLVLNDVNEDELEVDKFDNPDASNFKEIQAPTIFKGDLKHYQIKGLRWLDNLYEQGINGILADEMGLGKTIQAISLLAHLVENKGVWGPFLIIVPVTTLHNWQNELQKFCPKLKVLPYFGSPEERKKLGRFLDPKNLYNPNVQINVLLTSYNLIVNNPKDQQKLIRVKWHYMILDEAQAIKNNLSRRWKILLQFNARNRLLLTGTPIQNSMAELWALLHFIMPKLFDSHEQFQEWFSKDIEQHSMNQGEISKHQLKRLHLVLKPFMLRRLKKDVEQEIGPKKEYELFCDMTHRQRVLYQRIKMKISTKDLFQLVDSKIKMENLMNLVMQFRKVCNHPELFERRVGRIPFAFRALQQGMQLNPAFSNQPDIRISMKNPITYEIPKLVFDECFLISDNQNKLFRKLRKGQDIAFSEVSYLTHMTFFNIFNTFNLYEQSMTSGSGFGILRLLMKSNKWSFGEMSYLFVADQLIKQIAILHFYYQKHQRRVYTNIHNNPDKQIEIQFNSIGQNKFSPQNDLDINVVDFVKKDRCSFLYREQIILNEKTNKYESLIPLIPTDHNVYTNFSKELKTELDLYVYRSQAEPIEFYCRSGTFARYLAAATNSSMHKKVLIGKDFKPKLEIHLGKVGRDRSSFLQEDSATSWKNGPPIGYPLLDNGVIGDIINEKGSSLLELPNYGRLVTDCAKMKFLDNLLKDLRKNNHRCLIFCQMTRMLDILEDFLNWRKYTYFRMDGSTSLQDRRYMVEEYQKNPDIFAFLLSTRAGGLGVNLTGADTVIFYDNDWNPTMDAQATDRAHRIGQTKAVSVYRIVTRGTVEEKIVKRARQKQNVQTTVYGGNALKADVFRPKDVVEMLLDDQETKELKDRSQKFLKTKRMKRSKHEGASNHHSQQFQQLEYPGKSRSAAHHDDMDDDEPLISPRANLESPQKKEKQSIKKEEKKTTKRVQAAQQIATQAAEKVVKQQKQSSNNIFSTVRAGEPSQATKSNQQLPLFGIFNVTKAVPNQKVQDNGTTSQIPNKDEEMAQEYNEDEIEEESEEEEEYDEEQDKAKKFLEIFEQSEREDSDDSSDVGGLAIQFFDEEGNAAVKDEKDSKGKKKEIDEDEDDEPEEY